MHTRDPAMAGTLWAWKNCAQAPSLAVTIMLQNLKSQIDSSFKSMQRLLQRPIKLDEGNLKLGTSDAKQRHLAREAQRQRVRQMRHDLYALLRQHPSTRKLMRHLAIVERTLQEQGLEGFEALPHGVVAKALSELERLVWDWSPTGLADLRSRMAVLVKRPPRPQPADAAKPSVPAADVDRETRTPIALGPELATDVTEIDHAEFEEMERSWVGVVPTPVQAAPASA